jgi:lysophospholipase L1-like esterase
MRFVGLGDSLTQGVGDPKPGRAGFHGELEGWVEHFAQAVRASGSPVEVHNVAIAGARLEQVLDEQLNIVFASALVAANLAGLARCESPTTDSAQVPRSQVANQQVANQQVANTQQVINTQQVVNTQQGNAQLASDRADIVSCFIGVNDLWDINLDFGVFAERFDRLFATLVERAPLVLTASIHDVFAPYPIRAPLRKKLLKHIAAMNEIINQTSLDHSLVLVDFANRSDMFTRSVLAVDFLHPNRYGHQLIAGEVLQELHLRGSLLDVSPPEALPIRRGSHDLAHVAWVSGYVKRNWRRWREEMDSSGQ